MALPLLFIVANFAHAHWSDWRRRLLITLFVIVCVAALGPVLSIPGHRSVPMPWMILSHIPLLNKALPARVSGYCFLILGIILSLWLVDGSTRSSVRIVGASLVVMFTLPNLSASYWVTQLDIPAFFGSSLYTRYLSPGDNVLILPYGMKSNCDIWQATNGFYFRMAGGYVGIPFGRKKGHYLTPRNSRY